VNIQQGATYRVGNHQARNVYRGDEYIGVMFSADDAALVVAILNKAYGVLGEPDFLIDGEGDRWNRVGPNEYLCEDGFTRTTLNGVDSFYGPARPYWKDVESGNITTPGGTL
jgi:hypothetical protein